MSNIVDLASKIEEADIQIEKQPEPRQTFKQFLAKKKDASKDNYAVSIKNIVQKSINQTKESKPK